MAVQTRKVPQRSVMQRLAWPSQKQLPASVAKWLIQVGFSKRDMKRIIDLSHKAQSGTLDSNEQAELNEFEMVGHFLSILHLKARASLIQHDKTGAN